MLWSGWPTTLVSQLTLTEWKFSLRAKREVLIGYSLRSFGAWHVFGDDRWVWFNGVLPANRGAIEIVSQWAEAENLATSHRHWRWVHWRNPSNETVHVTPRFLLAPPLDHSDLRGTEQMSRTIRIWTLVDAVSSEIVGTGVFTPPDEPDDDEGGEGEGAGGSGFGAGMMIRPLDGQQLREIELTGDERFLPIEEIDGRIERILDRSKSRAPHRRPKE